MATILAYTGGGAAAVFPLVPGLAELARRGHAVRVVSDLAYVEAIRRAGVDAVASAAVAPARPATPGAELPAGALDRDLAARIADLRPDVVLVDSRVSVGAAALPDRLAVARTHPYGRPAAVGAHMPGVPMLVLAGEPFVAVASGGAPPPAPDARRIVGRTPWDPDDPAPAWLAAPGPPWVLVHCGGAAPGAAAPGGAAVRNAGGGSGADAAERAVQDRVAFARSAVAALRDDPVRVVVTLGDVFDAAHLIAAPNVQTARFLPHRQVLRHAVAVVCRPTVGLATKALVAGVPIVAVVSDAVEQVLARRVVDVGIGVSLAERRLRARRLRRAVQAATALTPAARRAAVRYRDDGAPARFADAVLDVLRRNASG